MNARSSKQNVMSSSRSNRSVWHHNIDHLSNSSSVPIGNIDNEILEKGNTNKEKQIHSDTRDSSIEKSLKESFLPSNETSPLRPDRFYASQKLVKSFSDANSNDRRFINEWHRQHKSTSMDDMLEQAAEGIIKEGIELEKQVEAEWLASRLRAVKGKSKLEMETCLISLYTNECFLYRLVNTTLRENDQSKVDTLGAYAHLLFHCDCSSVLRQFGYAGELYRGAQLDEEAIESYKQAVGLVKTWDAFSSTSKNRAKAEKFGNVLFIINRAKSTKYRFSGMDVSSISCFPEEEEVLIRAARNFIVEKVERDDDQEKYFIFLSIC